MSSEAVWPCEPPEPGMTLRDALASSARESSPPLLLLATVGRLSMSWAVENV